MSIPETARTVVWSQETVLLLVRAPVLYLEDKMTTTTAQKFIGIDISKTSLDVAIGIVRFWQFGIMLGERKSSCGD